ncbi:MULTISPECIES: DUF5985 family protein [Anaeromyxobacter]|uniref:DUF5985 family protein n=2 Tax=Anaeromyxobacteraceae TaxID=1524215 RepID=UPI001F56DAE1|nr:MULTISPECIES: DUF5985 family protein [unclassified Anaeromyxobacter]
MMQFVWGALAAGCAVAGLFFLRFWRESRDRLFAGFAAAFFVLALNWAALGVVNPSDETRHLTYLLRLVAFLILIWAIVDKNRRSAR